MRLGTASWMEGIKERRVVVGLLEGDPGRLADLGRLEQYRLARLGEGRPDLLAEALVPGSLRQVLEGGPRAVQRARQALAYGEKWLRRGGLPEALAPSREGVRLLPCLPRPAMVRSADGRCFDRLSIRGSLDRLPVPPGARLEPALGLVGLHRGRMAGCCLAAILGETVALGNWLWIGEPPVGRYAVLHGDQAGSLDLPLVAEGGLPTGLRPGEVCLFGFQTEPIVPIPGATFAIEAPFDHLLVEVSRGMPVSTIH